MVILPVVVLLAVLGVFFLAELKAGRVAERGGRSRAVLNAPAREDAGCPDLVGPAGAVGRTGPGHRVSDVAMSSRHFNSAQRHLDPGQLVWASGRRGRRRRRSGGRRSSSSWKSIWRAQVGVAEEAEAAAGGLAGGLEQVEDQAPAAAVAGRRRRSSTWVTATALWSTWKSQPRRPGGGGPVVGRRRRGRG